MDARQPKSLADERGFTMPELATAAAITLIIFAAAMAMFDIGIRSQPEIAERNARVQDAQIALEQISRELRQSYTVEAASPTSITILTYNNRTTCGSNAHGTARQCRVVYSCASGACTRTAEEISGSGTGPAREIVSGLLDDAVFSFSPNQSSPESITATLQLEAASGSSEDAITVSDAVLLRNVSGAVGT